MGSDRDHAELMVAHPDGSTVKSLAPVAGTTVAINNPQSRGMT